MSRELPVVVEYRIADIGHLRFYLAPKIEVCNALRRRPYVLVITRIANLAQSVQQPGLFVDGWISAS